MRRESPGSISRYAVQPHDGHRFNARDRFRRRTPASAAHRAGSDYLSEYAEPSVSTKIVGRIEPATLGLRRARLCRREADLIVPEKSLAFTCPRSRIARFGRVPPVRENESPAADDDSRAYLQARWSGLLEALRVCNKTSERPRRCSGGTPRGPGPGIGLRYGVSRDYSAAAVREVPPV